MFPVDTIRSYDRFPEGMKALLRMINVRSRQLVGFAPLHIPPLLRDRPQLIHAHFGPAGYNCLALKKMLKVPLITSFYGGGDVDQVAIRKSHWLKKYRTLFSQGDLFLVEGEHIGNFLVDMGCSEEKVLVYHLGVDTEAIHYQPRKKPTKNRPIKILIASTFTERKGVVYALKALHLVLQQESEAKVQVTIIGDAGKWRQEKLYKQRMLDLISQYQLDTFVTLLGYQPYNRLIGEYYNHDIFVHPSIRSHQGDTEGGSPVSITEALASGMPVLSTYHCDIPSVVTDGKSGYLVPERNPKQLADRLLKLINNPQHWEKMGKYGRQHVEKDYDLKTQGKKLEQIYDQVLDTYNH
jgi:colanic acid/amylovoran biosynthesis glycosyltransferase